ncbi:MAG: hypothetical protein HZB42_06750 [Sphingobacteriales bacterium]|nr:hypothetical protein [Sphingobacteriales bacterium]
MNKNTDRWKMLFWCCLGLFTGTAFCMKWMEGDFIQSGRLFTIIGLEISYPKEKVITILSGLDEHVKTILRYHLNFDFVFMAGVYPGITALCMMARKKVNSAAVRKFLLAFALLQLPAWGCDVFENLSLLKWINDPVIGNEFGLYHFIVASKWIIALTGATLAIPILLFKKNPIQNS